MIVICNQKIKYIKIKNSKFFNYVINNEQVTVTDSFLKFLR